MYVLVGIWHELPSLSFDRVPPDSRTLHLAGAHNIRTTCERARATEVHGRHYGDISLAQFKRLLKTLWFV